MSPLIFIVLALALGAALLWVLQEMVFRGRWSYFIYFLVAYLPIYITTLSIVYQATESTPLVTIFQLLKDLIVILGVLLFILYQKRIADYPFKLNSVDISFLAFLSLAFLFLVLPVGDSAFSNKAIYFKNMLMPGLVYFLGRNTRFEDEEIGRVFKIIFVIAIGAFLVNLVENYLLGAHLQQYTGYALYNSAINAIEPSGNFGLSWTFETQAITKRLASFFSDPLEMAASVLMGFAAGLIWLLTTRKEFSWPYLLIMIFSLGSLIFSSSRAAFGAFFIMLFFIALVFRLYKLLAFGFFILVTFALYILFFASEDFYYFVLDTITFENASSVGHLVEWLVALDSIIANPLGVGLAMSGNLGSVSDELRIGGENQFLIYGVQIGVLGLVLYSLLLFFAITRTLKVFRTTDNLMTARVAFTATSVKVGLLLPLFTANADLYVYVSWVSWWMVGYVMNQYSKTNDVKA